MSINIKNMIYPENTIESLKIQLFKIYKKDYGDNSLFKILDRWRNTIFITESDPVATKFFFDEHKDEIKDIRLQLRTNIEYLDYVKKQQAIDKELLKEFEEYITFKFQIYSQERIEELWKSQNKESFSLKMKNDLFRIKRELVEKRKKALLDTTIWGRRMKKKYKELSKEQLTEILFQEIFPAVTCVVETRHKDIKTVCHIPLIRNKNLPSLDRMVLHELRHVVEADGRRSGLSDFNKLRYNTLNEIRTEQNAKHDEELLPEFFSRDINIAQSIYELYISKLESLGDYRDYLNLLAFYGNFESEEELLTYLNDEVTNVDSCSTSKEKIVK